MSKNFFEVFPAFETDDSTARLLGLVDVVKVSAASDMTEICIYIDSTRLIDKVTLRNLEKALKDQLFPGKSLKIRIHEHFSLSKQYTPENLFEAYKESILEEFKFYSIVEYRILKKADITFVSDDTMELTVEETSVNMRMIDDLISRIEHNIFRERCGIILHMKPVYIPAKEQENHEEYFDVNPGTNRGRKDDTEQEEYMQESPEDVFLPDRNLTDKAAEISRTINPTKRVISDRSKMRHTSQVLKSPGKGRNPDILYGRDFEDNFMEMKYIAGEMGEVIVHGEVTEVNSRYLEKSNSHLYIFTITDYTDSISVKMFVREDALEDIKNAIVPNTFIKLCGITTLDKFDGELIIGSVHGIKKCDNFLDNMRTDNAKLKRVELHCHTKMSDLDGVSSAGDIIKKISEFGMDAVAITDHGNIQAFPEALHTVMKMKNPPKIIYGVEGYLVDDQKELVVNPEDKTLDDSYVVFDIETTGFSPVKDRIIEIGAVKVENGEITDRFSTFVNPKQPIPFRIESLTGINDSMVMDAPDIESVLPKFLEFCSESAVVAHNASFDTGFIRENAYRLGLSYNPTIVDTVALARLLLTKLSRFKLDSVARALDISLENHHRAVDDAECTAQIFVRFVSMLRDRDISTLAQVSRMGETDSNLVKKMNMYHVIILCKNETGRVNLYKLISASHLEYFNKRPRIPKSLLAGMREGLIIGSACEAGELFNAIIKGESEGEIRDIAEFYDYLEIQPVGNNRFMIESDNYPVESEEDIRDINRRIVKLGEKLNKPVVATCDVHFLNPEDEIYRRIIFFGNKYDDADNQPPLFLRTTQEMLDEFEYLGPDKCEEVVITNTRKISDMIDRISPVRPDKCPPQIENSDNMLKDACYANARKQYGEDLPRIVEDRLEKELHSIITNGFAVMYIIAKKLVEKSNSDGYLVGSRGSVGSSFAAYTAGITEVNPLPPHYFCTDCKYVDFESEEVRQFAGMAGCDMPDKICPNCGKKLEKDGFDIPFETFLGFKGDKEPDIDLNFSGEYQSHAHDYTEVIFGKGHTFRAGTVGALATKTAYGYVKNYFEEHGTRKRKCEINRLIKGCVGVRRTTGQHPGGIIVLPHGEEINTFTPVQHPANDMMTKTITTHFDYHAIDHNLLKLDILGHQDPTMVRMLQDLTGIDPVKDIPLDSKEVMSLFQDTSALGIKPEDIGNCPLGALGVPEFGTDFAMQMLLEAKPMGFSDLVRIAGLAHGTDVWLGNAQTLIKEGTATIRTAICTRDDIMIYLIEKGMDQGESFKIMESVRKGAIAKHYMDSQWDIWKKDMKDHEVPDWYIGSCEKIMYMFPKAHAAAYVMMAWRIAYCKIFYPLAYYAAYYSIRASGFSYELMCEGKEKVEYHIEQYNKRKDSLTAKELDTLRDMRIVQEMYARGFEFIPIDLYKAQATKFSITEGKIMPALSSIDGLGETAALQIVEAAKNGEFISKDDFKNRAKIGQTLCDLMDQLGILGKMPESDQISVFDLTQQ